MANLVTWAGKIPVVPEASVAHLPDGVSGPAIERLAAFEALAAGLRQEQERLSQELSELRLAGKQHSYQFRERMAKKLTNSSMLTLLEQHGLAE